jgi:hypothetical protein
MIPIEQHLCNTIHRFVKEHLSEIKDSYDSLGFKDEKDMLKQIKNNWETAFWAMTELCAWGMKGNYLDLFLATEGEDYNIYGIDGRYIKKPYFEDGIVEVKQVVKTIKVIGWEEVK